MLNNRKIRLMTKLAHYETGVGKKDIKLGTYYKNDYVRYHILKTIVAVTVGYAAVLLMIILYELDYLIAHAVVLDYKKLGSAVLGIYIMLLTVYLTGTIIGHSIHYDRSRKKLGRYFKMLKNLRGIYREEDGEIDADIHEEDTVV